MGQRKKQAPQPLAPPEEPRLPPELSPLDVDALQDETEWQGALVSGVAAGGSASYLDITTSRLHQVRLTGIQVDRLRLVDVALEGCEMSGAVTTEASVLRSTLSRGRLSGWVASRSSLKDVRFDDCRIDDANLRMTTWERARFVGCHLAGTDFSSARLHDVAFLRCNLSGARFTKATFERVSLHGSELEGIIGAEAVKGDVVIGSDQMIPLAAAVFAAVGIRVDDDVVSG
jgi:hypothetical protein